MADEIGRTFLDADYGNVGNILSGILLILALILFIFLILVLISLILNVIGKWKVFKKAGEPGWKALIPIYNTYTQCEITGVSPWWLVVILIFYFLGSIFEPFKFLGEIASIYFLVIISISTARSFGKSDAFGVGLIFLAPIFYMILGFDTSKYEGKNPTGDILQSIINDNETNKKSNEEKTNMEKPKKATTKTKKVETKKKTNTTKKSTTTKKTQPKKKSTAKTKTTRKNIKK